MQRTVFGMVDNYTIAQEIVQALEREGIVGAQVEIISGADDEVLGKEAFPPRKKSDGSVREKISHFFHSLSHSTDSKVHDDAAEDPEFYASHIRQGRAMIIVRLADDPEVARVSALLHQFGAYSPADKHGPETIDENARPESTPPSNAADAKTTIGDSEITTGGTRADLEGRGQNLRKPS